MHFASLVAFPPTPQVFKLQPPHIVKGRFQDPGRTREYRILKVGLKKTEVTEAAPKSSHHAKIVKFRKKHS